MRFLIGLVVLALFAAACTTSSTPIAQQNLAGSIEQLDVTPMYNYYDEEGNTVDEGDDDQTHIQIYAQIGIDPCGVGICYFNTELRCTDDTHTYCEADCADTCEAEYLLDTYGQNCAEDEDQIAEAQAHCAGAGPGNGGTPCSDDDDCSSSEYCDGGTCRSLSTCFYSGAQCSNNYFCASCNSATCRAMAGSICDDDNECYRAFAIDTTGCTPGRCERVPTSPSYCQSCTSSSGCN